MFDSVSAQRIFSVPPIYPIPSKGDYLCRNSDAGAVPRDREYSYFPSPTVFPLPGRAPMSIMSE